MDITMTPVQSSMLKAHGYDEASQTLQLQFSNGNVFQYEGVSPELAAGLAGAESLGKFFNANIRGKFEPKPVEMPEDPAEEASGD